jgi:thiol-disulfide isomerase/thioredoxin
MRLLYLVLLITCLTGSAVAQPLVVPPGTIAPEDAAFNAAYPKRAIPVITGRLLNLSANEISALTVKYSILTPFAIMPVIKPIAVQPDGRFSFRMEDALPYRQLLFEIKDLFNIHLYTNTDLILELDMTKLKASQDNGRQAEGVHFLGTDGPLNTWLYNYTRYKKSEQNALSVRISNLEIQPKTDSTLAGYKEIFDSARHIQDSYIAANSSPYAWILENERLSYYYDLLVGSFWFHKMDHALWQEISAYRPYLMSNEGISFYKHLAIYVSTLPDPNKTTDLKEATDRNIRRLDSLFAPEKADLLKLFLDTDPNLSDEELVYAQIRSSVHTPWCLTMLNNQYDRINSRITEIDHELETSPGNLADSGFGRPLIQTAFGASLYDASGLKAPEFLAKLKQHFPGKALIIDRWATWCIPCLNEMPFSKELQQESAGLPVVFVYLCTTKNSTDLKWRQKVAEIEQPGVHILIDEALDKELTAYFSFRGYPGYALIDQTGKYRRGAITWISTVEGKDALEALIK